LIAALRPFDLEELGFSAALHKLVSEYAAENVIAIHLSGIEAVPALSRELEFVIFRVVQESLSNVIKHAQAKNAWIDLVSDHGGIVSLTIRDDGRGFPVGAAATEGVAHRHLGLLHMQERVKAIGGMLVVESVPTAGTRVAVTLPISGPGRKSSDEFD
jgi:signal transduction histidine kinase